MPKIQWDSNPTAIRLWETFTFLYLSGLIFLHYYYHLFAQVSLVGFLLTSHGIPYLCIFCFIYHHNKFIAIIYCSRSSIYVESMRYNKTSVPWGGDLNGTEVIKILVIHMVQVKDLFPIFILFWSIDITELNDLRKTICLRKSEVCVEKKKLVCNVIENLAEHGVHNLSRPLPMTS